MEPGRTDRRQSILRAFSCRLEAHHNLFLAWFEAAAVMPASTCFCAGIAHISVHCDLCTPSTTATVAQFALIDLALPRASSVYSLHAMPGGDPRFYDRAGVLPHSGSKLAVLPLDINWLYAYAAHQPEQAPARGRPRAKVLLAHRSQTYRRATVQSVCLMAASNLRTGISAVASHCRCGQGFQSAVQSTCPSSAGWRRIERLPARQHRAR